MSRFALAMALATVACGSTIDVGQSNADGGGVTGSDGGMSASDTSTPLAAGTADVTGMVDGQSFVVKDAVGEVDNQAASFHEIWVSISDHADVCSVVQQGAESIANTKGVRLDLTSGSVPPLTIGAGTYTIGEMNAAKAYFAAFFFVSDASCTEARTKATAGTVTIAGITSSAISGTFDLTFPSGSLKGSFGASLCGGRSTGGIKCAQ